MLNETGLSRTRTDLDYTEDPMTTRTDLEYTESSSSDYMASASRVLPQPYMEQFYPKHEPLTDLLDFRPEDYRNDPFYHVPQQLGPPQHAAGLPQPPPGSANTQMPQPAGYGALPPPQYPGGGSGMGGPPPAAPDVYGGANVPPPPPALQAGMPPPAPGGVSGGVYPAPGPADVSGSGMAPPPLQEPMSWGESASDDVQQTGNIKGMPSGVRTKKAQSVPRAGITKSVVAHQRQSANSSKIDPQNIPRPTGSVEPLQKAGM